MGAAKGYRLCRLALLARNNLRVTRRKVRRLGTDHPNPRKGRDAVPNRLA
jgi:hypothetical protein